MTSGVMTIMIGRAKWKPLGLPLPEKVMNQNQYHVFGETTEISANFQDLKESDVSFELPLHLTLLSDQCRRPIDHGE